MKKQSIKLNSEIEIDIEKLIQSRMVILANSGGGKSYAIRRIAEQASEKIQTIIIDPEGEFASLREKHDFILCGKDADVPVESRSAALLATKLLELNKSAVIDLYELHPQERQRFVKLFCDALVNAPKALYHPVLIILDEAHDYVPEGKPSEATYSVEALASKGRKRGQCLILASQRISKLSKNASAECNNKLIGRASQDIDYIRAGAELGFSKSDSAVKLRNLKPGEFFAFGPAISDDVIPMKIGDVHTTHAKVGYKSIGKVPPASDVIKKVLAELKDLPQEAEKEAKTVQEMKQQITQLKRELTTEQNRKVNLGKTIVDLDATEKAIKRVEKEKDAELFKWQTEWQKQVSNWLKIIVQIGESLKEFQKQKPQPPQDRLFDMPRIPVKIKTYESREDIFKDHLEINGKEKSFGRCSKAIYSYLFQSALSKTKTQVAIATGYSQNSGGFNNSISELSAAGIISRGNSTLTVVDITQLNNELYIQPDTSLEKWLSKLGACSRAIWAKMLEHHPDEAWTKEQMAQETGYSATSGGFNNSLYELSALGLIERMPGGMIRINPEILNL